MNPVLKAGIVALAIFLGLLIALGMIAEPRPAFSQAVTPVVGTPVCWGPACQDDFSFLPTVLR